MKIESIIQNINIPVVRGQVEVSANNSGGANSSPNSKISGSASSAALHIREEVRDKQQDKDKQSASAGNDLFALKAVLALDKDKNVVIRFLDKKGEIVRQIPPEEYINMVKKFRENVENLFSKEV